MPYKIHPSRRTWTLEETKIPQRAWTLEETQIPHRPNSARRAPPRRDIRGALLVNPSFQRSNEPVLEENMEPQMMEAPMPRAPSGHHRVAIKRENINLVRECEWDVKSLKDDNDGRIKTTLSKPLTLILGFVCLTSLASLLLTLLVVFGSVGTGNCPCARNKGKNHECSILSRHNLKTKSPATARKLKDHQKARGVHILHRFFFFFFFFFFFILVY